MARMEYVLMDIKNFLKKLENGQLEIEAGQWEMHKALTNMSKVVSDIKNLREDVDGVRLSSLQQMGLIRNLKMKLDKLNKMCEGKRPVTVSESSVKYERVYKRPTEAQVTPKGFKKRKCRIRSEEIIEITSQVSNEKSDSGVEEPGSRAQQCPEEIERTEYAATVKELNSNDGSSGYMYQGESYCTPERNPSKGHFAAHSANNDILQRYLKDSIKYIERKASNSTQVTHISSHHSGVEKTHSTEYTPFWDEYSSRAPPEAHCENRMTKQTKEQSKTETPVENILPKRLLYPKNPKKFVYKADALRRDKKHRTLYCRACGKGSDRGERSKDHETAHRVTSRFKGFRCSYCGMTCSTPEKLTSHLRGCRIIMKAHHYKK